MSSASSPSTAAASTTEIIGRTSIVMGLLDSALVWMWRLGTVVVGLVAIAGGLLYVKQESLLYLPEVAGIPRRNRQNPQGYRNPTERGIQHWYDVRLMTADNVEIHAWFLVHPAALLNTKHLAPTATEKLPTLIFFHGNAGNIGLRLPNALQMLQHLSCHVLLVEYRGYGDSSDKVPPSEEGLKKDAQAVYSWLASSNSAANAVSLEPSSSALRAIRGGVSHFIDIAQLYLFGRSLGGAVAFSLAEYVVQQNQLRSNALPPVAGLIVENTFLSISAMVDKIFPFLSSIKQYVLRMDWNSYSIARKLHQTPILYLAGARDDLVPHFHMTTLHQTSVIEAGNPHATIHVVPNGTHNETWYQGGIEYWKAMETFLKDCYKLNKATTSAALRHSAAIARQIADTKATENAMIPSTFNSIPTMTQHYTDMAKIVLSSRNTGSGEAASVGNIDQKKKS